MKKNGLVPIHARITINGKQPQFNTKLKVLETNWKSGRAIGKSMKIQRLNSMLDSGYLEKTHPDLARFFHPNYALRPISTTFTATITNGSEYQNPGY